MQYLRLVILVSILGFGLNTTVFAQICCPAGCVQDSNRCVTTGPNPRTCNSVPCSGSSSGSSGGGSGRGGGVIFPRPLPPACVSLNQTRATRDAATDRCVNALSANAQLWGCLFEDDAGRLEDQRTGLSCPARQAALANQCRARCATFAANENSCTFQNDLWQSVFGDIGGFSFGSARVDLCGPRLRSSFLNRVGRSRPQRLTP